MGLVLWCDFLSGTSELISRLSECSLPSRMCPRVYAYMCVHGCSVCVCVCVCSFVHTGVCSFLNMRWCPCVCRTREVTLRETEWIGAISRPCLQVFFRWLDNARLWRAQMEDAVSAIRELEQLKVEFQEAIIKLREKVSSSMQEMEVVCWHLGPFFSTLSSRPCPPLAVYCADSCSEKMGLPMSCHRVCLCWGGDSSLSVPRL